MVDDHYIGEPAEGGLGRRTQALSPRTVSPLASSSWEISLVSKTEWRNSSKYHNLTNWWMFLSLSFFFRTVFSYTIVVSVEVDEVYLAENYIHAAELAIVLWILRLFSEWSGEMKSFELRVVVVQKYKATENFMYFAMCWSSPCADAFPFFHCQHTIVTCWTKLNVKLLSREKNRISRFVKLRVQISLENIKKLKLTFVWGGIIHFW